MVVGGAFGIMIRTGAIESGLIGLIRKAKGAEKLLIPILFVLFSLGGAVFGMGEEALPFTMILCPLFVAVGYDSVIAVLVTYVATQIGFGSSWMNPFSVGIAQGIAGIDVFSGAGFRMVMWVVFTVLGCGMTMFYASKIKKTPTISIAYKTDAYFREQNEKTGIDEGHSFGLGHIFSSSDIGCYSSMGSLGSYDSRILHARDCYSVLHYGNCFRCDWSYL